MNKSGRLKLRDLQGLLPKNALRKLYWFASLRTGLNLLDILGLGGVALLAVVFSESVAGALPVRVSLPAIGITDIDERDALVIAFATVVIFTLKSVLSIWLKLRTAMFVASIETDFSTLLAEDYFSSTRASSGDDENGLADFQNRATASTEGLALFINARLSVMTEAALLLSLISVFLVVNPVATAAALLYLSVVLWSLGRVVRGKIQKNGLRRMEGSKASLSISRDLFVARREVRAAGALEHWIQRFTESRFRSASSAAATYTLSTIPRYVIETSLVAGIFVFLGFIVVFSDLSSQAVTIGVFMAGGLRLVALLIPLQASLNQMVDGSARGSFAFEQLKYLKNLDGASNPPSATLPKQKPIGLEMQGVGFEFHAGEPILQDVNFTVEPGQKVALVGPSGAGKSTCFELATGILEPKSGKISVGGLSPKTLLDSGQGAIGIVPQRSYLVTGTLAENVSLVSDDQTDKAQAASCLAIAGLINFSKPDTLEMQVQPDSGQFSGGEIQRIGLARALYGNPGIIFLDEATSALDAQTESVVSHMLDTLRGGMTIVMVAHRLSTVKTADKVIYLDQGRIIASGSFADLQTLVPDFDKAVKLMGLGE